MDKFYGTMLALMLAFIVLGFITYRTALPPSYPRCYERVIETDGRYGPWTVAVCPEVLRERGR